MTAYFFYNHLIFVCFTVLYETLSVGCYNYPSLFLLSSTLRSLADAFPNFHPHLEVVPFRHIYRMLDDGDLDAVIGFREPEPMKISAIYEEIAKVPVVCVCRKDHPLAQLSIVSTEDMINERLVLFTPARTFPVVAQIQGGLMGRRSPSELYFCDSGEAIVVLVNSGFGVSVLPDLSLPRTLDVTSVPFSDAPSLSFGVYHRPGHGSCLLDTFVRELKKDIVKITQLCI